jgi:hypothetical protein
MSIVKWQIVNLTNFTTYFAKWQESNEAKLFSIYLQSNFKLMGLITHKNCVKILLKIVSGGLSSACQKYYFMLNESTI